uniref:Retrotransposon protein, putative, Ty3-gypsy subclass, expressed n=1 Tax=Oryza sativa subsp. japonica TaxID=39947 RepID=Q2R8R0_ORYSJ|nr:retrotransposon protein, putative, Ty3-gypsy subclass, expressed [Oryza sativa Japonica Group]
MAEVANVGTKSSINNNEDTSRRRRRRSTVKAKMPTNGGIIGQPCKRKHQSTAAKVSQRLSFPLTDLDQVREEELEEVVDAKEVKTPKAKAKSATHEIDSIALVDRKLDATPTWRANCRNMNSAIIKGGSARDLKVDGCRDKGFRQSDNHAVWVWGTHNIHKFGADGLLIGPPLTAVMGVFTGPDSSAGAGDLRGARSRLGLSYARRPDGKESLFGDESRAELDEVLVFCSSQIASLY